MERNNKKILVVDDETDILNLLEYNLTKAGFDVVTAGDGPEAIELAMSKRPGLIVLDIMLPNMDGTEVLKRLKADKLTRNIPVVMLTAKGEEMDRVIGFELGAEDYITKPFSPREFLLRVKALLKRAAQETLEEPGEGPLSIGELSIDPAAHSASVGGVPVELSSKEFKLLCVLIRSRGRVISRDGLLDRVWGLDCYVLPRTVDTHIRRLRAKLKDAGRYIETVRGAGYRFKGGV